MDRKPIQLADINDGPLQRYLTKRIMLTTELQLQMTGREPYEIVDGEVRPISVAEYRHRMLLLSPSVTKTTPVIAERCRHATVSKRRAKGCKCKGHLVHCGHLARHGLSSYTARCIAGKCPHFETFNVSAILPARNEGTEVASTIASFFAAGVNECVVVDDASTDRSCDGLAAENVVVIRNRESRGPSYCRNAGAAVASGDVLIFADAHERATDLRGFAAQALEQDAVICASCQPLGGRPWIGYGGRLTWVPDGGFKVSYNLPQPPDRLTPITGLIGACYAMSRKTYAVIRGWPSTVSWGYNEQALSLAAHFAGIPLLNDSWTIVQHQFKKRFNYPVKTSRTHVNRYLVHWLFFHDTWEAEWLPIFQKHFGREYKTAMELIESEPMQRERDKYIQARKRTDAEVLAMVSNIEGFNASRRKDGK